MTVTPLRRDRPPTKVGRPYTRIVAFGLSREEWQVLEDLAAAELRDPVLHARWLVLQAIRAHADEPAS